MRIQEPTSRQVEEARGLAQALDVAVKRCLHRWFGDNGAAHKAAIAEALDTSVGSVSRQLHVHDLPVQLRTLAALQVLLPDLAQQVKDEIGTILGDHWRPRAHIEPSAEDLRRLVSCALQASAGAASQALADLADGVVQASELDQTMPLLTEAIRQLQLLQASLVQAALRPSVREVG